MKRKYHNNFKQKRQSQEKKKSLTLKNHAQRFREKIIP